MVNEVIKAVASATVGGVSLVATAPTLTVVDASTTVGEIVAVQFSSIEPNVNSTNYGIDNLTEVSTDKR